MRVGGKRRDMGLDGYPDVPLAQARDKLDEGIDPIQHRQELKSALAAERAKALTFEQAALAYIKLRQPISAATAISR